MQKNTNKNNMLKKTSNEHLSQLNTILGLTETFPRVKIIDLFDKQEIAIMTCITQETSSGLLTKTEAIELISQITELSVRLKQSVYN